MVVVVYSLSFIIMTNWIFLCGHSKWCSNLWRSSAQASSTMEQPEESAMEVLRLMFRWTKGSDHIISKPSKQGLKLSEQDGITSIAPFLQKTSINTELKMLKPVVHVCTIRTNQCWQYCTNHTSRYYLFFILFGSISLVMYQPYQYSTDAISFWLKPLWGLMTAFKTWNQSILIFANDPMQLKMGKSFAAPCLMIGARNVHARMPRAEKTFLPLACARRRAAHQSPEPVRPSCTSLSAQRLFLENGRFGP